MRGSAAWSIRLSRADFTVVLSELAALDLADILQYTLEQWGERQMDVYAAKLNRGLRQLAANPRLGKPRDDWYPGCRCFAVEHHLVLYEVEAQEVRVARFFHERVDVPRHL
ncbi:MAG: type II toxin-antitoxin system RelE/ParE family toxin [Betaproteobacteria bacterium]|nr:type II toxin-antitoxin system RelE/ParE family toxin [Betaproteobacteria bacterium]